MITISFLDSGRQPRNKPDPRYPEGMTVDLSNGADPKCGYNLPYPAPRCGVYAVMCGKCGARIALTVAGRADDPRVVVIPCKAGTDPLPIRPPS